MAVVKHIALGLAAAVVAGVLDGGVARVLMRGVALATREPTAFSLEATLGIMLIFAITAVPLAVTAELTSRRQALLTAGVVGTVVLGFFAVSIGLQEVASAEGLGVLRWTALVACLAGLAIVVLLQPWVVLGVIRRGRIRGAAPSRLPEVRSAPKGPAAGQT